jgi:hypothetical protein
MPETLDAARLLELFEAIEAAPEWEREIDMNCAIASVEFDRQVTAKDTRWEVVLTKVGRDGSEEEDTRAEALAALFTTIDRQTLRDMVVALRQVKTALGAYYTSLAKSATDSSSATAGALLAHALRTAGFSTR